jgi:phosphatidylinositol alpha-mannosyltransferase
MRIAQVCPYSLSLPGGVQGQVLGLARSLRATGHTVTVLAPTDGPPPEPGVRSLGRSIPLASNGSVAPIAPDLACARRTVAALRDGRYDVVHIHEPLVPGPAMTALLYSEGNTVATFHRSGGSKAYTAFKPLVSRWARRIAVRAAVSPEALATARAALGGEYELVFNGIELEPFVKAEPWPTSRRTVLFLGRHEERKGLAVLLAAVQAVELDLECWVVGDGPETERLRSRYASDARIRWIGRVSDEERASRMKGADVVCAPSIGGESFGVVVLEAMAAGTPVVASDLPGYRNVARDGVDALLVPPGDVATLSVALTRVLEDRQLASTLACAGEARAAELSMDHLAERYTGIYRAAGA